MTNPMSAEGARAMAADLQNGKADKREIAATLRAYADTLDRQTVTANCCECGRIIDTREECDGGDRHGCQLVDKRWVRSRDCWDKNVGDACQTVDREALRRSIVGIIDDVASSWTAEAKEIGAKPLALGPAADAILALMPVSVVARELEWGKVTNHGPIKTSGDKGGSEVTAKGLFNTLYGVASIDGDKTFMVFKNMTVLDGRHASIEAAKAAAQAHYNDAISKAVKPGPDVSGLVEALEAFAAMRPDSSEAGENIGTMRLTWEADTDLFTAPIEMTKRARQALGENNDKNG